MLPDAVRRLVNLWSVKPGERAVVLTVDDRGLAAAEDLAAAGVEVAEIFDLRDRKSLLGDRERAKGLLRSVHVDGKRIACDLLVMSGSPQPSYALLAHAGARVEYDAGRGIFVPTEIPGGIRAVGSAAGDVGFPSYSSAFARRRRRKVIRLHLRRPDRQRPEVRDR